MVRNSGKDMIQEIRSQRPLITAWVQMGRPFAVEGSTLRVSFPSDQKMSVESLNKANTRKFLEGLLTKLAGQPVGLKLELGEASDAPTPSVSPSNGQHAPVENSNGARASTVETSPPIKHGSTERRPYGNVQERSSHPEGAQDF